MRAGVDPTTVVLVGPRPGKDVMPASEAPFIVPFPRNADFVGRDGDLSRLHATLSGVASGPVGIRPAGLTGMGGIGKTQLAVEYVYRHKGDFPDGIFWIDAASSLAEGLPGWRRIPDCDGPSTTGRATNRSGRRSRR